MFENFAHNLGISLELQAFTIIKEIKKIMIHSRSGRGQRISKGGGGEIPNIIVSNATRPE